MSETTVEHQRPSRRQWRTWVGHDPTLAGLDYDRLRHELRHGTDSRKDELLAALVCLAHHNPEAVAVVTACLLPGLRGLVARHARGLERTEALAVAVAGLCESVAQYRPDDHTPFVASRLLRLPKHLLQRAVKTQDTWHNQSRHLPDRANTAPSDGLSAATFLRLAVDAGVLSARDAWLIHTTRVFGHSLGHAARQLGIRYEAAKKRRQRAESRWAAWWAPEARQRPVAPVSLDPLHKEIAWANADAASH